MENAFDTVVHFSICFIQLQQMYTFTSLEIEKENNIKKKKKNCNL